jgi:hypothetical protein
MLPKEQSLQIPNSSGPGRMKMALYQEAERGNLCRYSAALDADKAQGAPQPYAQSFRFLFRTVLMPFPEMHLSVHSKADLKAAWPRTLDSAFSIGFRNQNCRRLIKSS